MAVSGCGAHPPICIVGRQASRWGRKGGWGWAHIGEGPPRGVRGGRGCKQGAHAAQLASCWQVELEEEELLLLELALELEVELLLLLELEEEEELLSDLEEEDALLLGLRVELLLELSWGWKRHCCWSWSWSLTSCSCCYNGARALLL